MTDRVIRDIHDGDLHIDDEVVLEGIVSGDVHVRAGGSLQLKGIVGGDLTVGPGCSATVRGIVNGSVISDGGRVDVWGMVQKGAHGDGILVRDRALVGGN